MPTIKDFETKHGKTKKALASAAATKGRAKRRPGRDKTEETPMHTETQNTEPKETLHAASEPAPSTEETFTQEQSAERVRLDFYGSDILRAKAPKAFEVAETVVEEWKKDGQFEGLPVGHPLAQLAAAYGLRKAKKVEKKLEEKGVFMMARMGLEYAKSKLNRR